MNNCKILRLQNLNDQQKQAALDLQEECNAFDNIKMSAQLSNEMNYNKHINSFFLIYDKDILLAFISLFIPTENEAEATAYTRPSHRKKGLFKTLIQEVRTELQHNGIERLLLVSAPCESASQVVSHMSLTLLHSEYLMKYTNFFDEQSSAAEFLLLPVTLSDCDELVPVTMTYFDGTYEDEKHWFDYVLSSKDSHMYKAVLDGKIIGSVCVQYEESTIFIFGLGIDKTLRGKGYGKRLLILLLKQLKNYMQDNACQDNGSQDNGPQDNNSQDNGFNKWPSIMLNVGSKNEAAFSLYQKNGFTIISQIDYYI